VGDGRYQELLGVATTSDQPTYYELLGLPPGAPDAEAIDRSFREKMTRLQQVRSPKHKGFVEFLKEELRHAKLTLSSDERRGEYDAAIKERRLAAVRELLGPVLALGALSSGAMGSLVSGVAAKQGLSEADARALVEELLRDYQGAAVAGPDQGPAAGPEPVDPGDGGRTLVSRKLRGAERRAPAPHVLGDLLRALAEGGELGVLQRFGCPLLVEDPDGLLGKAGVPRAALEPLSLFPIRRSGTGKEVVVGRATTCDLRLDVPSVSSRHALFRPGGPGGAWLLSDTVSTNGTFLDGKRLPMGREVEVGPGASLVFGAYRALTYHEPAKLLALLAPKRAASPPSPPPRGPAPPSATTARPPGPRPDAGGLRPTPNPPTPRGPALPPGQAPKRPAR
jgi:hypothetical protein